MNVFFLFVLKFDTCCFTGLHPCRRHGVVARSGAALVPLGPGPEASQPVHHHPPQRYKLGNPVTSLPSVQLPRKTKNKQKKAESLADHKHHLVDERTQQISLDAFVAAWHVGRNLSQDSSALVWN